MSTLMKQLFKEDGNYFTFCMHTKMGNLSMKLR